MPSSLIRLIAGSPTLRQWSAQHGSLVEAACSAVASVPDGLSLGELAQDLEGIDGLAGRELIQAISRTVPALGLFRLTASGRFVARSEEELARPIASLPLAVIDLEATGGRPPLHRPIEVALVRREPGGRDQPFESLTNPERPLPRFVSGMTGVRGDDLAGAPAVGEVTRELARRCAGALLVFHGSPADAELINYELHLLGQPFLAEPICCTIALTRHLLPDQVLTGLDNVARRLGLAADGLHRALIDAQLTLAVFDKLRAQFESAGIHTVADLAPFQGTLAPPPFLVSDISVPRLNALPEGPGAYVLRDAEGRVLLARPSGHLRSDLATLFFPAGAIPDYLRAAHRGARTMEVRTVHDARQAPEVLESMLAHTSPARGPVHRHAGRRPGPDRTGPPRRGGPARSWDRRHGGV